MAENVTKSNYGNFVILNFCKSILKNSAIVDNVSDDEK